MEEAVEMALCHPRPLYGGDMDNPVVVRAAEVCRDAGLATLRFNFRGVGASGGTHGGGEGKRQDALAFYDFGFLGPCRKTLLLVAGARDPCSTREEFQALAAGIPGVQARVIEDADHFFFGMLYPLGEAVAVWAHGFSETSPGKARRGGGAG